MTSFRTRRGSTLLEVIAAMTVLVIGGLAGASLMAGVTQSINDAQRTDRETAAAAVALERVSTWSRARLENAIGETARDSFTVHVERVGATLFRVSVLHPRRRARLLETVVYRPEDQHAPTP